MHDDGEVVVEEFGGGEEVSLANDDIHADEIVGSEERKSKNVESVDDIPADESVVEQDINMEWFETYHNEVMEFCEIHSLLYQSPTFLSPPPLPIISSLNHPTFHLLSQDSESNQVEKPTTEIVENISKIVEAPIEKRILKPSFVCRSPYVNKKTVVRPSITTSEFALSMDLFSMVKPAEEIVFSTGVVDIHRLSMETLCPNLYIETSVVDVWCHILNFEEKFKNPNSPSRFFFNTIVINSAWYDNKKMKKELKFELFESNVVDLIGTDKSKLAFKGIDLVFFPICRHDHFYVLVFDLRVPSLKIIDNMANVQSFIGKYKKVCNLVQFLFGNHLESYNNNKGKLIEKLKPQQMKMPWMTTQNVVDCGVFVMHHLETYLGQDEGEWSCGLASESNDQIIQLRKLRVRFACKMITHQLNIYANRMIESANKLSEEFTKDELKQFVINAIRNRELRIKKAESGVAKGGKSGQDGEVAAEEVENVEKDNQ